MKILKPGPGQESVWDYPRPPRLERTGKHIRVYFNLELIADTKRAWRVLETSHPPVYYIPPQDIRNANLIPAQGGSWCEWKGKAVYFDVLAGQKTAARAAWSYPNPTPAFVAIKDHVAFYAGLMDRCLVDKEEARPQPGGFYGGWITSDVVGPFKGEEGTSGW
jgi:uncharacterized protein (DUF427 family)